MSSDPVNAINNEIFKRNFPNKDVEVVQNPIPQKTRDLGLNIPKIKRENENCIIYPPFSERSTFMPGTRSGCSAPFSGYATQININSDLLTLNYKTKNPAEQYIPCSSSDLYNTQINQKQYGGSHQLLFTQFANIESNKAPTISNLMFNNPTRNQLKNT